MVVEGPRSRLVSSLSILRAPDTTYARWEARYGRTYRVRAVNGDVICTSDTDVIRDLFRAKDDEVEAFRPDLAASFLGDRSVLALSGEAHRRERKLLMPPFHGERMRAYGEHIQRATLEAVAGWSAGDRVVMADTMLAVSLAVIARAVFGATDRETHDAWVQDLRHYIEAFSPLTLFVPALQTGLNPWWRRFERARDVLDARILDAIAARRREPPGDDVLSMLAHATYEDGSPMPDRAALDELKTLLFAGHETTQISMAWAIYQLHRTPDALARLQAELDAADGAPDTLAALPYLDGVVQETLRIDPIVPDVLRTLTVPLRLGSFDLPAGTHLAPLAARVHADPAIYPNPRAFDPSRFVDHRFRPWEFLPFGGGTRRCLGAALATYEMRIVLGTLLKHVELALDGDDRMVRRTVTLAPEHGVRMRVTRIRADA
ncbi:MAG: cytochrome P450 [Myxococcales bacterium]|nr:cytochrome P450 [Myxococcales bacterium]MCB9670902.1 cytochrome P450 [Alphaproteobacteria bacterium]MCB9691135.1 cytochrome P450 [Alphaproteobacteria bacterium]